MLSKTVLKLAAPLLGLLTLVGVSAACNVQHASNSNATVPSGFHYYISDIDTGPGGSNPNPWLVAGWDSKIYSKSSTYWGGGTTFVRQPVPGTPVQTLELFYYNGGGMYVWSNNNSSGIVYAHQYTCTGSQASRLAVSGGSWTTALGDCTLVDDSA